MDKEEFEFQLLDRIAKIQSINRQYDLENNSYIAFSGGKDSTVLSKLIDLALPNNKIPRVYANTGIEYGLMTRFVKEERERDHRIIILNQSKNIIRTLDKYGYPFKSKVHSDIVDLFQRKGKTDTVKYYLGEGPNAFGFYKLPKYQCSNKLRYQFTEINKLRISKKCCDKLKKEISYKWQQSNNKPIVITGLRKEEGGARKMISCLNEDATRFHPLAPVNEAFMNELIEQYNVRLCELYYPPYNFERTGCKGCPFNKDIQNDLTTLYKLLPKEYYQCLHIWKPVYDEYIRIGYRLKEYPHKYLKVKNKKLF